MHYTENFKRQVVKKLLSPGQTMDGLRKKLKISYSAIKRWKSQYAHEFEIKVEAVWNEKKIDIDELLRMAERDEIEKTLTEEMGINNVFENGKTLSEYSIQEKYAIVKEYRKLPKDEGGIFLRTYGLYSQQITLWEEEVLEMSKKQIDKDEYIRQLESEKKGMQKKLKSLEKDNHDLKVIIELKKKYPELFKQDEED